MKLEELHQLSAQFWSVAPTDSMQVQEILLELGLDPGNLYQELEMSCRFVQAHQDVSKSSAHISLHSHNFCEILCCRSSCGAEYLVGTQRYRLQKGDIIIVPPGVSHRPLLPEVMDTPYVRDVLWLSPEFIELLGWMFPQREYYPFDNRNLLRCAGTRWSHLPDLLRGAIAEAEQQKPGWDGALTGTALTFLSLLNRAFLSPDTVPVTAEKPELLDQVMVYIEENLSSRITLADTARKFFVSSSTISHLFQQRLGVSFYRCVTQRRLIAAKELISGGKSMEEVARLVGFADYSSFYRAFRQEYGISPRQYRNLQVSGTKVLG